MGTVPAVASDPNHQLEFYGTLADEVGSHLAGLGKASSVPDDRLVMAALGHFPHGSQGWEYILEGADDFLNYACWKTEGKLLAILKMEIAGGKAIIRFSCHVPRNKHFR